MLVGKTVLWGVYLIAMFVSFILAGWLVGLYCCLWICLCAWRLFRLLIVLGCGASLYAGCLL